MGSVAPESDVSLGLIARTPGDITSAPPATPLGARRRQSPTGTLGRRHVTSTSRRAPSRRSRANGCLPGLRTAPSRQPQEFRTEEERKYANDLVIETEEKLQTGIEQRALPILEQLRHEQTDFLSDYNLTMNFFQFVSHQYMRTRASRERVGGELRHSFPGWDFGHLKHLVCHCAAENIGASLFVDRNKFQIVFLRNGSKDEFITGDQPIVNLFRSHGEDSSPTELALYYPLNPHLSMILLPGLYGLSSMKVPPPIVDDLNNIIAQKAREFIVAKKIEAIQRTTDGLHEGQEQDGHVLLECIKRMATRADECER